MLSRHEPSVLRRASRTLAGVFASLMVAGCPGDEDGLLASATAGEVSSTGASSDATSSGSDGPEPAPTTGTTTAGPDASSTSGEGSSTTDSSDPFCGDGVQDPGEACDWGPMNADDAGCTSACEMAECGDGLVMKDVEECDEGLGNSDEGACTLACTKAVCGDFKVYAGVEECDDEVKSDAYGGCTESCTWGPHCGDGEIQGDEECDDGEMPDPAKCSGECTILKRVIFVSSEVYAGDLGGLAGADIKCQVLAAAAKLPRAETFRAWLSAGGSSPSKWLGELDREMRYQLPSGTTVANNWAELTSGELMVEINQTEAKKTLDGGAVIAVWSGTKSDGSAAAASCSSWMSSSSGVLGRIGHAVFSNSPSANDPLRHHPREFTEPSGDRAHPSDALQTHP